MLILLKIAYNILKKKCNLNQNTPGVKRSGQVLIQPCWKRCEIKQAAKALCFCQHKGFCHDDFTTQHHYFMCSRPSDVIGIKTFNKDNQATKYCSFILMCCSLVILIASYLQQQMLTEAITYSSNFTYGSYSSNYLQQQCCLQQQLLTTKLLIAVINNSSAHFLTAAVPMATIPMTIPMTAILMTITDAPFTNSSNNL